MASPEKRKKGANDHYDFLRSKENLTTSLQKDKGAKDH